MLVKLGKIWIDLTDVSTLNVASLGGVIVGTKQGSSLMASDNNDDLDRFAEIINTGNQSYGSEEGLV